MREKIKLMIGVTVLRKTNDRRSYVKEILMIGQPVLSKFIQSTDIDDVIYHSIKNDRESKN